MASQLYMVITTTITTTLLMINNLTRLEEVITGHTCDVVSRHVAPAAGPVYNLWEQWLSDIFGLPVYVYGYCLFIESYLIVKQYILALTSVTVVNFQWISQFFSAKKTFFLTIMTVETANSPNRKSSGGYYLLRSFLAGGNIFDYFNR